MKLISVIGIRGLPGIQGGVEKHCENMYQLMPNDVRLRVYRRKPYLTELSNKTYPNIEFIDLPSTRIKGFEAVFHTFISVIHILFHRPDAVHIHNIGPAMFTPLLRLFSLRVVLTYHSPNYEHQKWGVVARNILLISEYIALRFSNVIVFVNKFQMAKYGTNILRKSHYIPNGVNLVGRSERADYIKSLNINSGDYILAVGRLTPEKGFEYLIEAVNKLPQVRCLVIAGASDHDTSYLSLLKALDVNNKVIFTGYTDGENLRQLYSHARLFVLPSINEGFPLVMLEAMGYNLPMIVSDIPATHLVELTDDNYVSPGDSGALVDGISRKLLNSRESITYNLIEYDWQTIANHTSKLF